MASRTPFGNSSIAFVLGALISWHSLRLPASSFVSAFVVPHKSMMTNRGKGMTESIFPYRHVQLTETTSATSTTEDATPEDETLVSVIEEDDEGDEDEEPQGRRRRYNPLWPNGLDKDDIEVIVDEILADKNINMPAIPDIAERQIYRATTVLTLNAVYRGVGWVHGRTLFGHEFTVEKLKREQSRAAKTRLDALLAMKSDVDEELLEEVADRLLANKAINQALVPDIVERAVYVSCLKIIFRILNMIAASFRVTVCGHDLTLKLEKAITRTRLLDLTQTAQNSATEIDTQLLNDLAREAVTASSTATNEDGEQEDTSSLPLWKQGVKKTQEEFLVQLHAVLYCLILGILDDLLANTELVLMSDRIHFDIVTQKEADVARAKRRAEQREKRALEAPQKKVKEAPTSTKKGRLIPFLLGLALGVLGTSMRFVA